jgi:hypothetical protein
MKPERTIRVYEVLADLEGPGPYGDGLKVFRFRAQSEAEQFAYSRTCYGKPAHADPCDVPLRIARRWGLA